MTADTETIREALDKRNMLTDACLWCGAVVEQLGGAHAISCPVAALGRVEERHTELLRRSEALVDSIVREGGRLLNEHAWNAWVTEIARARAALAGSVAGEQEQETA